MEDCTGAYPDVCSLIKQAAGVEQPQQQPQQLQQRMRQAGKQQQVGQDGQEQLTQQQQQPPQQLQQQQAPLQLLGEECSRNGELVGRSSGHGRADTPVEEAPGSVSDTVLLGTAEGASAALTGAAGAGAARPGPVPALQDEAMACSLPGARPATAAGEWAEESAGVAGGRTAAPAVEPSGTPPGAGAPSTVAGAGSGEEMGTEGLACGRRVARRSLVCDAEIVGVERDPCSGRVVRMRAFQELATRARGSVEASQVGGGRTGVVSLRSLQRICGGGRGVPWAAPPSLRALRGSQAHISRHPPAPGMDRALLQLSSPVQRLSPCWSLPTKCLCACVCVCPALRSA